MASAGTGGDNRRLSGIAGARLQPTYRTALHRLLAVKGRAATDYKRRFVVAARGSWLAGAKIHEKLSRRKIFVRRDGSKDRPMGNLDAPALHAKAIDEADSQTQENIELWRVSLRLFVLRPRWSCFYLSVCFLLPRRRRHCPRLRSIKERIATKF